MLINNANLTEFAKWLQSPKNAQIAKMVIEQDSWVDKLNVACHLWNRPDDGDSDNARYFRDQFGMEDPEDSMGIWCDESVITPLIEEVD